MRNTHSQAAPSGSPVPGRRSGPPAGFNRCPCRASTGPNINAFVVPPENTKNSLDNTLKNLSRFMDQKTFTVGYVSISLNINVSMSNKTNE